MAFVGPNIVTDGLVLYLDPGNSKSYPGTGTAWNDLSGNGNNGTLINGPTFNSANGGSIVFDGINDYSQVNQITSVNTSGTISVWFKPSISWDGVANNMRFSGINGNWEFGRPSAVGGILFDLGGSGSLITSLTTYSNQKWYDLTCVWDIPTLTSSVYINGKLDNTGNCLNTSRTGTLTIARSSGNTSEVYSGNMSAYKYYNRALTIQEIFQNYNATKSRYGL